MPAAGGPPTMEATRAMGPQAGSGGGSPITGVALSEDVAASLNRQIIYTANYALQVTDAAAAAKQVQAIAAQAGGFLASMDKQRTESGRQEVKITVRVPSRGFGGVVDKIETLGKVLNGTVMSDDVTKQFVDLQARLKNTQRKEARLADLMNRTGKLSEIMDVSDKLSEVQQQVEQIQGELRYLREMVTLSTIGVTLSEEKPAEVGPLGPFFVKPYVRSAVRVLVGAVHAIIVGVITVVIVGALVWVPLLIILLIWLYRRAKRRRRAAQAPE